MDRTSHEGRMFDIIICHLNRYASFYRLLLHYLI